MGSFGSSNAHAAGLFAQREEESVATVLHGDGSIQQCRFTKYKPNSGLRRPECHCLRFISQKSFTEYNQPTLTTRIHRKSQKTVIWYQYKHI